MYPVANLRDKITLSRLLEKWELELADTPEDVIDIDLFITFLNRHVVSKDAGERGLHKNNNPNNRSSRKGRKQEVSHNHTSDRERVSTSSALFSEAQLPLNNPSRSFCKGDHGSPNCPLFNGKLVDERWKLVQDSKLCYNCLKSRNLKHFSKISC